MNAKKKMDRRQFLKTTGIVLGASLLTCGGAGALLSITPKADMLETTCAGDTRKRVLVAYASKTGSTAEVAEAIGNTLCDSDMSVDIMPIQDAPSPEPYDAIILGSAIYMGKPMGTVSKYITANQGVLAAVPTGYFVLGVSLANGDIKQAEDDIDAQMQALYAIKASDSTAMFAGRIDYEKLSPLYRTIIKSMNEEGDWRDWEAIAAWACSLPALFGIG